MVGHVDVVKPFSHRRLLGAGYLTVAGVIVAACASAAAASPTAAPSAPALAPAAFGVFLRRQFFLGLPAELEDAARIVGAISWGIFAVLLLPLSKPALALFTFQATWNDFNWPLIVMTKQDRLTLPVALSLIRGDYTNDSFGPIMAGAVISAIPILVVFLVANQQIIEGVQFSGLKM
jgi:multiple sugar transport system permease protein